ncbi:chromate transporter [Alkaliphilus serpentinus]|uniref:Chromate transporter n=1 Tax=Alkaliphilus serpentinus TaxID=1482731 RepID=A0A833ME22_9FIRM|nr:chromate transporter [Alkaliphilus serpentinus]KAB3530074.1 chromate transporter [Alkaliphilus serpentinus]
MVYVKLFLAFLKIGAFSFGGGYAMLPLIEQEIVYINNWLSAYEFVDIIAISQMSPGPIAINAATFVGFKHLDVLGAVVATIGVVLVSFLLVTSLAQILLKYYKSPVVNGVFTGLRPAVIGLMAAACVSLFRTSVEDFKSLIICIAVLVIIHKTRTHPILIILLSGIMGIVVYTI